MAVNLCNNCYTQKSLMDKDVVVRTCEYVSSLCNEITDIRCKAQSKICITASRFLNENNLDSYLHACYRSRNRCPYNKRRIEQEEKITGEKQHPDNEKSKRESYI